MSEKELERQAAPHEDDLEVSAIEVRFAIPVFIPPGAVRDLCELIEAIVSLKKNQVADHLHWVAGVGSKMIVKCQADQALLGLPVDPDLPRGPVEPEFDHDVLSIDSAFRPMHEKEKAKRDAQKVKES